MTQDEEKQALSDLRRETVQELTFYAVVVCIAAIALGIFN